MFHDCAKGLPAASDIKHSVWAGLRSRIPLKQFANVVIQ